jgi:hypothetical protein
MNVKPLLYTICVAWATWPLMAMGQPAGPSSSAPRPATDASTPPAGTQAAARVASAQGTHPIGNPWAHAGYPSGPDFPGEYTGAYSEGVCCDESCYHGYFLDSWIRVPCLAHWGSVEYLLWWRKGEFLPPLVSNGPLDGMNDQVFFGGGRSDFGPQPGGRLTLGLWLDDHECFGVGGRYWALGDGNIDFRQADVGGGNLSRPFIDANTGNPNAVNIAGALGGSIGIETRSEVHGGDVLFRKRCECSCEGSLDFVFGYQFARLDEVIDIRTSTTLAAGPPNLDIIDLFDARNEFHGGVVGFQANLDYGALTASLLAKVGLGNMNETMIIAGAGNPAATGLLGLLAQNSNVGFHKQDSFAVLPEINLNLGYRVSEHFELTFGYSMIYFSHVLRPGDAIDLAVDITPLAAPIIERPAFNFNATDFWVMGFNLGAAWSY